MGKKIKVVHVQDIASSYSTMDIIDEFCHGIRLSDTGHERDVIIEPCSMEERANMDTSVESSTPYFYVHLHIICERQVLISLTSFKMDFMTNINVAPSQITSIV